MDFTKYEVTLEWLMQGDGLSCNKNISKTRSYWNAKYQTCFLVVDWE